MNAVGIDVSKGKSMVAILRPGGEIVSKPFVIRHLSDEMHSLIEHIKSLDGESRIVWSIPDVIMKQSPVNFPMQASL